MRDWELYLFFAIVIISIALVVYIIMSFGSLALKDIEMHKAKGSSGEFKVKIYIHDVDAANTNDDVWVGLNYDIDEKISKKEKKHQNLWNIMLKDFDFCDDCEPDNIPVIYTFKFKQSKYHFDVGEKFEACVWDHNSHEIICEFGENTPKKSPERIDLSMH